MMRLLRRFNDLGIRGASARWYDNNSKNHRLAEMRGYAKEVSSSLRDGNAVLEVAPGPGYLSIELAKMGRYKITGIDISRDFVDIARHNAVQAGVNVQFFEGNVSSIPFPDETFDFVVCTAAFKNFKEPLKAIEEMYRVLRQDGKALIVDMRRDASNPDLEKLTNDMHVKGAEALFMKLSFKYFLKKGAYTREEFSALASKSKFKKFDIKEDGVTFSAYLTK